MYDVLQQLPAERQYRTTLLMLISATMKLAWMMEVPLNRKVYCGLKGCEPATTPPSLACVPWLAAKDEPALQKLQLIDTRCSIASSMWR